MTLRHLKIFIAVCETGTITAAGEKLFIAQPSISLAVSELETHYGIKLFDRISRKLYITEVGKQFLQYATHIVSLFDEMEKGIKNWDSLGKLRIGSSITIGNHLIPVLVKEMKNHYPLLDIEVVIDNSQKIESYILENTIDIGLIEGNTHSSFIHTEPFRKDELCFICALSHEFANRDDVHIYELNNRDFLLREKGSAGREIFDLFIESNNISINECWQSTSTQALINAVSNNIGISLLPYLLVKDNIKRKEISSFKVENLSLHRDFSLIYHKNKFLTENLFYFIELCKNSKL